MPFFMSASPKLTRRPNCILVSLKYVFSCLKKTGFISSTDFNSMITWSSTKMSILKSFFKVIPLYIIGTGF